MLQIWLLRIFVIPKTTHEPRKGCTNKVLVASCRAVYTWLVGLDYRNVNQDVLLFTKFWYICTSLTKGNFSKPILLLFVILYIYNFTSYMSKKYMTDSFLLSNLLAYLAATQYPLSIFFFFFSILHTVAAAAGSYMEADVLCFALLYTPFSPIWHTLEDFQRIYQTQIFFIFRICWPCG